MSFIEAMLLVAGGVALSILIPAVRKAVEGAFPGVDGNPPTFWEKFANAVVPYLKLGIFSLLVSIIVVAFVEFDDWRAALLGGYAWDSTVQKIKGP